MLLLGIDLGTSSVKVSVVDAHTQQCIATAQYPESEAPIQVLQAGWAEQSPLDWWHCVQQAILLVKSKGGFNATDIAAIGIAYQMHGLVVVDQNQQVLRESIIWCDSRAVSIGEKAFQAIGQTKCLSHLLNSPGNFTASKLKWVQEQEPQLYARIHQILLPGDFIAMKLTGTAGTTIAALSEGIFWDFATNSLSADVFGHYGFDKAMVPEIKPVFGTHGNLLASVADVLGLRVGIPVTYKAGDQPNNALSLNVLEPGEVAATAGTSGVIYGVSDQLVYDKQSRVNSFAHVNHTADMQRIGVLLCINGTGISYRWMKDLCGKGLTYHEMNQQAAQVAAGAEGLRILPFGNGAERMLGNRQIGAHLQQIDLNKHSAAHLFRAVQEGIAAAFRYGLDIMRSNQMFPSVIRAGKANLFNSDLFASIFVNTTQVPVELYENDGSMGAAMGAGIGAGIYANAKEAFASAKPLRTIEPDQNDQSFYEMVYQDWRTLLEQQMQQTDKLQTLQNPT